MHGKKEEKALYVSRIGIWQRIDESGQSQQSNFELTTHTHKRRERTYRAWKLRITVIFRSFNQSSIQWSSIRTGLSSLDNSKQPKLTTFEPKKIHFTTLTNKVLVYILLLVRLWSLVIIGNSDSKSKKWIKSDLPRKKFSSFFFLCVWLVRLRSIFL